jgi:signal transduction histidine kinase
VTTIALRTSRRNLSRFSRDLWLTLGVFVVFAIAVILYAWSEMQVDRASALREQSHLLAEQLSQSSDELTRAVRTYVVTLEPGYKEQYQEILDIRDGRKPRASSLAISLLERMRRGGFTEEEFAKLAAAKANSDALTRIELRAMALVESANGSSGARRAEAIRILHDPAYHQAKLGIIQPIAEVQAIADERTRQAVRAAKSHATGMLTALVVFGLLLVSLLWRTRRNLHAMLGGTVNELSMRIARLGSGDFSSAIPVPPGMEDSVLGWLSETQINLARIDAQRKRAEEEVQRRTGELSDSVLASLNMMEDAVRQRENAEQAYVRLEQSHQQLMEASRRDGMAEVATSVLHNVGNVLNSVNVSASLVAENVQNSRAGSMAQVVALLREHEADLGSYLTSDPKGRHIAVFLQELADHWLAQQQAVVAELSSLRSNIDHIKEIVAVQQSHARASGPAETVELKDLVEASVRMNADSLSKHDVRVVREFAQVPPVRVEKHKVLQILVNLVRNAKQACSELPNGQKCMTLRIALVNGRARISVSDNGAGIAPENLTRVFAHGFTTRKDGHGFGLHSGALAASELGGSLSVHSDGPGKGATFTLELAPQPAHAAA